MDIDFVCESNVESIISDNIENNENNEKFSDEEE